MKIWKMSYSQSYLLNLYLIKHVEGIVVFPGLKVLLIISICFPAVEMRKSHFCVNRALTSLHRYGYLK